MEAEKLSHHSRHAMILDASYRLMSVVSLIVSRLRTPFTAPRASLVGKRLLQPAGGVLFSFDVVLVESEHLHAKLGVSLLPLEHPELWKRVVLELIARNALRTVAERAHA